MRMIKAITVALSYSTLLLSTVFLMGCPPLMTHEKRPKSYSIVVSKDFTKDCKLGTYASQCWRISIKNQSIEFTGTFDDPIGLPDKKGIGRLTHVSVEGKYTGKIKVRVSPVLLIGTLPPLCAMTPPVDGPDIATTAVKFAVTGDYEYTRGKKYDSGGKEHRALFITKSNLRIEKFNIHNVWSIADDELRKLFKNTVRRAIDREVAKKLNEEACSGCTVPDDLPVYAEGYSPYNAGGFCK